MPVFSLEEVEKLSKLKAVFYAAGSVQNFAKPFLEKGVKIISSWSMNAIPVAEYTLSQIILANKGFYHSVKQSETFEGRKKGMPSGYIGNYEATVGLLGAGMIGRHVINLLKPFVYKVLVFDPFLSYEEAEKLNVEKVDIKDIFERSHVVSNHLADLPDTVSLLKGKYFKMMMPNATFINTGRGRTVEEDAMTSVLEKRKDIAAVLDVTYPEPPVEGSKLYSLENVFLTPHIAGSIGQERWRMVDFVLAQALHSLQGKPIEGSVDLEMLKHMA